jgi:glycosyltransferase involved in cell wall biosynthesis
MNSGFQKKLAGFIITYRRPDILSTTIDLILNQTLSPEKLLIIDNGDEADTRFMIQSKNDSRLVYFSPGSNLGPAGAAALGLDLLAKEGFQWIFWGDDNDPPRFQDAFYSLINMLEDSSFSKFGIVGVVGQRFSKFTGNHLRVPDDELLAKTVIPVDVIAGGHCMLVKGEIPLMGILPDPQLFFGFEELDYCLKVGISGYKLAVNGPLFFKSRAKFGKLNFKQPLYIKKKTGGLERQYYSTRNTLIILARNSLFQAFGYQLLKAFGKVIYGFRFGWHYGYKNAFYILLGIAHFIKGTRGRLNFSI